MGLHYLMEMVEDFLMMVLRELSVQLLQQENACWGVVQLASCEQHFQHLFLILKQGGSPTCNEKKYEGPDWIKLVM